MHLLCNKELAVTVHVSYSILFSKKESDFRSYSAVYINRSMMLGDNKPVVHIVACTRACILATFNYLTQQKRIHFRSVRLNRFGKVNGACWLACVVFHAKMLSKRQSTDVNMYYPHMR